MKSHQKSFWLMKSEPNVFSFEDLLKAPKRTTHWEGVRNYQARNLMRDLFKNGDLVLFYHSNAEPTGIFGVCEVVKEAYPDSSAWDSKSKYFDPESKKKGINPWVMVDLKAVSRFTEPVLRDALKDSPPLKDMLVLKKGSRLSVQPVKESEFNHILKLGKPITIK
ncbi:MAG: EVE domain-containing protein [Proteobacteria bacterium]|nr:EVE domain-containing protein [Pseudomonadota bacterium]